MTARRGDAVDVVKVSFDPDSAGLRLTGKVEDSKGVATYRAVLNANPASTLGALMRSGDWKVDESFDFDDVDGDVVVDGERCAVARINAYRFSLSADLSLHLDYLQPGDASEEPSGNLHVAELRDPVPALLGMIRGLHEIGITEPEHVVAILRSGISLDEAVSMLGGPPLIGQLDGLRVLAALQDDDVPVRLADDGQSIALDATGSR